MVCVERNLFFNVPANIDPSEWVVLTEHWSVCVSRLNTQLPTSSTSRWTRPCSDLRIRRPMKWPSANRISKWSEHIGSRIGTSDHPPRGPSSGSRRTTLAPFPWGNARGPGIAERALGPQPSFSAEVANQAEARRRFQASHLARQLRPDIPSPFVQATKKRLLWACWAWLLNRDWIPSVAIWSVIPSDADLRTACVYEYTP